jgi:pilus assembly protein TadC
VIRAWAGAAPGRLAAALLLCSCGALLSCGWPAVTARRAGRHATGQPRRSQFEGARDGNRMSALAAAAAATLSLTVAGAEAGLALAVPLAAAAWWITTLLMRRGARVEADEQLALALDLVGAALRSGRPVAEALELGAPAAPRFGPALTRVAGLLRLGADPHEAWSAVANGPVAPVARVAIRSETSGIRLAAAVESLAAQLRAELHARGLARAHRAGVLALAPLGACFLPAFVCLGIVPVIVGIARSAGSAIP